MKMARDEQTVTSNGKVKLYRRESILAVSRQTQNYYC
jgi:hypothetical protein